MRKISRIKKPNEKKVTLNKKFLWLPFAIVFVALEVFSTIQTSASGAQIAALESEAAQLMKENRSLESKLVNATSLIQLENKAGELGFGKKYDTYYLRTGDSFAKLP